MQEPFFRERNPVRLNTQLNRDDAKRIEDILDRFFDLFEEGELHPGVDRFHLRMDITVCHLNGCPLRLQDMLDGAMQDLSHDVAGIWRHLDRETGKLTGCFLPRYAA